MKKRILLSFVLISAVVLPLFAGGQKEDNGKGVVISYNTPNQWANWGNVLAQFSAETGITAPNDPKNSGQTMAALEAESKAPQADVAYFGIVFGIEAAKKNLLEPYEPTQYAEIPSNLKDPGGLWMTIHTGSIAFIINTDELKDKPIPKSWHDLLDPMYKGMVGFLDPTQAAVGYSVFVAGNLAMGGTLDNWDPGVAYFKELYANGISLPAQTATAMVQQGEIPILIDADFNGYKLKYIDGASSVQVVIPEEGSISIPYVISLVHGAPDAANGKDLIDFALSDEGQKLFTESYLRPVRKIQVSQEISQRMLPGSEYQRVVDPDFNKMREVQESANSRWSSEVIKK
jgi:putative spermidine/putrescine transport system substrate-binding protein